MAGKGKPYRMARNPRAGVVVEMQEYVKGEYVSPDGLWYKAADFDAAQREQEIEREQHTKASQATLEYAELASRYKHEIERLQRENEALRAGRNNNIVACANCKQPVEVTALNAIKCEACKAVLQPAISRRLSQAVDEEPNAPGGSQLPYQIYKP